jgi:hypothetical protein
VKGKSEVAPIISLSDLSQWPDQALVGLRIQVDREILSRGLTLNVGELGERLVLAFFNRTRGLPKLIDAPKGAKNVDALSRDGDRYSIKTILKAKKTGTVYPDSKEPQKQLFEYLVFAQLTTDYQLGAIYRFSWRAFLKARAWDSRMNAWYIPFAKNKLALAELLFRATTP